MAFASFVMCKKFSVHDFLLQFYNANIVSCLQFHFDQSKVRSEIRLREGRTKPIDILTKYLDPSDDLDIEINEPYMVFKVMITCVSLKQHLVMVMIFVCFIHSFCILFAIRLTD